MLLERGTESKFTTARQSMLGALGMKLEKEPTRGKEIDCFPPLINGISVVVGAPENGPRREKECGCVFPLLSISVMFTTYKYFVFFCCCLSGWRVVVGGTGGLKVIEECLSFLFMYLLSQQMYQSLIRHKALGPGSGDSRE